MARVDPPIEHRFSSTNQPKKNGRKPGVSVLTELKKLLNGEIKYDNPVTGREEKGQVGKVIALRHALNAVQGEHNAITDILDRTDGKPVQPTSHEGGIEINVHILKDDEARPKR